MTSSIKAFAKFLDQPVLISKLNKTMPKFLYSGVALGIAKDGYDTFIKNKKEDKNEQQKLKEKFLKKSFILLASTTSAILAPYIASKITKRAPIKSLEKAKESTKELINNFLKENKKGLKQQTIDILDEVKEKKTPVLSFKQTKNLMSSLNNTKHKDFINKLIPEPENIKAKDIFSEIGYLSIYGAIPVVGGIASGIVADKACKEDIKKTLPDKLSEGLYQYLANIFLCNVGAGIALGMLEKAKITSKSARALGMVLGIISTGVIGGSKIANSITKKVIDPVTKHKTKERKPELIDLGMHTDDIATVAVLSGLKWIEPTLPTLYALSGYKAGCGYRN